MNRMCACCLIGSSLVLVACQTGPDQSGDTVCSLPAINVSPPVRAHLRTPLDSGQPLPRGYEQFIRDLAAHNAKIRAHCPT